MLFLTPIQQCQSTEGNDSKKTCINLLHLEIKYVIDYAMPVDSENFGYAAVQQLVITNMNSCKMCYL